MTMVLATHEMGFARQVADRVCFLDGGRVLEQGRPSRCSATRREPRTRQFLRGSSRPAASDNRVPAAGVVGYGAAVTMTMTHALLAPAAMPAARLRTERRALVRQS